MEPARATDFGADSFVFTSESVTEGHPDKIADQISDAVLDAILAKEAELEAKGYVAPNGQPAKLENVRCACETFVTTGTVIVAGEIRTEAYIDVQNIAREVIRRIGYDRAKFGFDCDTCGVLNLIHEQSPDIAQGVDESFDAQAGRTTDPLDLIGAGDQGMMFGYACDETKELMPLPISLAHKLAKRLTDVRKNGTFDYLRPDGKSQVTVEYDEDNQPVRVDTVVISTQHSPEVSLAQIREDMIEQVVKKVIPSHLLDENTKYFINPTGRFVIGGPHGDSGLTGRKIIVDTYGGIGRHGGGAFSGKDPTKVDRSAAYMCRWVAKHIVAAGLADKCELQVAYAIGYPTPVSIRVDTFGTGKVEEKAIESALEGIFSFKPADMVEQLDLLQPIYRKTTHYGHFTNPELPWEQLDEARLASLKQLLH